MSRKRSNQLSYAPIPFCSFGAQLATPQKTGDYSDRALKLQEKELHNRGGTGRVTPWLQRQQLVVEFTQPVPDVGSLLELQIARMLHHLLPQLTYLALQ